MKKLGFQNRRALRLATDTNLLKMMPSKAEKYLAVSLCASPYIYTPCIAGILGDLFSFRLH